METIDEEDDYYSSTSYKSKNTFKSKWANLKTILQDKTSFESSVKLLKKQTLNQFSSKCCEIYKYKIKIHLLTQINKKIFSSSNKSSENFNPKLEVKGDIDDLCSDPCLKNFIFYFRENNEEMIKLISFLNEEEKAIFVPFLCHFFYENFFMESTEQEEIFYIIYLLLEKEIDNLCGPLVDSFLSDGFISDLLIEMGNKYENKNYIDIILSSPIRDLDEIYSNYISMDIIKNSKVDLKNYTKYKIPNTFFKMRKQNFFENELFFSQARSSTTNKANNLSLSVCPNRAIHSQTVVKNNKPGYQWSEIEYDLKYEKSPINTFLNKNFFNIINENYLKTLFEEEKDEFMKHFYLKQLKKIRSLRNSNLYNCKNYYFEKLAKAENISKNSIDQYNEGYKIITNFIDLLLSNLSNKIIIPYNIKVICKIIYLLLKKKFKNISEMHLNILVCRFLFDKLIIPILENPDSSNIAKVMIISLNTRKTLFDIILVLKKLIRGELFSEEKYEQFNIFNKYILDNYHKLKNIIHNFINVKIPEKIILLLDKYNNNEYFSLENQKRKPYEVNYDYFNENPSEFMQHDSICFNITQFFIFYDIVNSNKNIFIQSGSSFEKIFKELSKYIFQIERSNFNYYVIIKENYSKEEKQLLFHEEKMIGLSKSKNEKELLYKLKSCITYLLSKIEISPQWTWVNENYDTKKTFEFINTYLFISEKNDFTKKVPLYWYSKYILNNLELINQNYKKDDFQLLYNEIIDDVNTIIYKLKLLNQFLTVNISTKFVLIENRKKNFKNVLKEMEKTELNIRTLFFLESAEVNVCFLNGERYNEIQAKSLDPKEKIDIHSFVISNTKYCPHRQLVPEDYQKQDKRGNLVPYHCQKIKDFAYKFSVFHKIISEEITLSNYFFGPLEKQTTNTGNNNNNIKKSDLNENIIIITKSPKDILDIYMTFVSNKIDKHPIFKINKSNIYDNENLTKLKKKQEKNKQKVIKIIWNYILKSLCIKIYESIPLEVDNAFKVKCLSFNSIIKPNNVGISKELTDENILNKIKYHLIRMDSKRTPDGMNEEFGLAVNLISSLYKFYLNENNIEAGDLLPFIIYSFISITPDRIIFNVNFSKYFLNQSELYGNIGYNMAQAESAINYIIKLDNKKIGINLQEFNNTLSHIKFNNE
jgi:hypothetical protein